MVYITFDTLEPEDTRKLMIGVCLIGYDSVLRRDPDLVIGVYQFYPSELIVRIINLIESIAIHINPDQLTTLLNVCNYL